jgi:hypothetical protein
MTIEQAPSFETQAETILSQLGGQNRLNAMIGAKYFIRCDKTHFVSFKFTAKSPSKINFIKITLTPNDTYSVEFGWVRGLNYTVRKEVVQVYADTLISTIEGVTGLRLTLN